MNTIRLNTIGDSPVVVKKGSQVQSQEKTVEITENGTTEVVPDAGYALSKVTINTNVESSGSAMEYLDVSGLDVANKNSKYAVLGAYSSSIKAKAMGYIAFVPSGVYDSIAAVADTAILAVAIDFNLPTNAFGQTLMTTKEYILSLSGDSSFTEEELAAIPRITKEQFYNLEA